MSMSKALYRGMLACLLMVKHFLVNLNLLTSIRGIRALKLLPLHTVHEFMTWKLQTARVPLFALTPRVLIEIAPEWASLLVLSHEPLGDASFAEVVSALAASQWFFQDLDTYCAPEIYRC